MIQLIVLIALLGLVVWTITFVPMPPAFETAIVVIASVMLLLCLLRVFGVWHGAVLPLR